MLTITSTAGFDVVFVSFIFGTRQLELGALSVPTHLLAPLKFDAATCVITLLLLTFPPRSDSRHRSARSHPHYLSYRSSRSTVGNARHGRLTALRRRCPRRRRSLVSRWTSGVLPGWRSLCGQRGRPAAAKIIFVERADSLSPLVPRGKALKLHRARRRYRRMFFVGNRSGWIEPARACFGLEVSRAPLERRGVLR